MLKKSVLNLAVGAALLGAAAVAHAEVVMSITITGGDFDMGSTSGQTACGAGGPFGNWQLYRVRDLALEREVALKVLHPVLTADAGVVERFRREAQLAAQVRHPHIVDVYDTGGRAGLLWYTMAYIPGENLAQWVQRHGPLTLDQTVTLLAQALSALGHAHDQSLIHRDLKPENLVIENEPTWTVQITDFGLALAFQGVSDEKRLSRSGTPEYAAPEQLMGDPVDQSHRPLLADSHRPVRPAGEVPVRRPVHQRRSRPAGRRNPAQRAGDTARCAGVAAAGPPARRGPRSRRALSVRRGVSRSGGDRHPPVARQSLALARRVPARGPVSGMKKRAAMTTKADDRQVAQVREVFDAWARHGRSDGMARSHWPFASQVLYF